MILHFLESYQQDNCLLGFDFVWVLGMPDKFSKSLLRELFENLSEVY